MDVTDKTAIVTGGGRGIGRAISLILAQNGATVYVADIVAENANSVAIEIESNDSHAHSGSLDVTDQQSVDRMVQDAIGRLGRIDILVNNAGIIGAPGWEDRERSSEEDWDMIYAVNVKGIMRVTGAVAPHMIARRYGKIINIASVAGRQGNPSNPPYGVSKAGVISLTQAQALELAAHNINVNAICPGLLWTPMWERIAYRRSISDDNPDGLTPRELFEEGVAERIPLKREQTPDDIGHLAAFLASDYAINITGQAINVSGGSSLN